MSAYFDSSTLVAASVDSEEHHQAAAQTLSQATDGFTSTHALAETFATLTSGRVPIWLSPTDAAELIQENVINRLRILELTLADYKEAFFLSQAVGARGGAVYDLLHLQAAKRGNASRIFTINIHHFRTFAPDQKDLIQLPRPGSQ